MNIHIPTYDEVVQKRHKDRNPLDHFIHKHEPLHYEQQWRADLHSLIEYVLRKEDK